MRTVLRFGKGLLKVLFIGVVAAGAFIMNCIGAIIKRWGETLPYFERGALPREVHLKAVRKAIESFRVPEERKLLLRSLPAPAK